MRFYGRPDPANWRFEAADAGCFTLSGMFSFATCASIMGKGRELLRDSQDISIDLSGVTHADSAGLALLLEWVGWAKHAGRKIHFLHLPPQLLAIARISEVEEMLPVGAAPGK